MGGSLCWVIVFTSWDLVSALGAGGGICAFIGGRDMICIGVVPHLLVDSVFGVL